MDSCHLGVWGVVPAGVWGFALRSSSEFFKFIGLLVGFPWFASLEILSLDF